MGSLARRLLLALSLLIAPLAALGQTPPGAYGPSGNSSSSGSSGAGGGPASDPNGIYLSSACGTAANCFPIFADTKFISDPTFAIGSNIVTCPNADCAFTAADTGKTCFGTSATSDTNMVSSTVILPQGTFTFTDATHGTCSGGNATANTTAAGFFVWGHLDTPTAGGGGTDQIAAASLAAMNSCQPLYLPSGNILIERVNNIANVGPANGFCSQVSNQGARKGFVVKGKGMIATMIIPTPNILGTSCTGPNAGGTACWLSLPGIYASDFSISCLGNSLMDSSFNGKSLIGISGNPVFGGSNFFLDHLQFLGCAGQNTTSIGLDIGHGVANSISGGMIAFNNIEAFGMTTVSFNPGVITSIVTAYSSWFTVPGNSGSSFDQFTGTWNSSGNLYGFTASTTNNAVRIRASNSTFNSTGDWANYGTGAGVAQIDCAAFCTFQGSNWSNPTTNGYSVTSSSTTATIRASNSSFTSPTAGRSLNLAGTDRLFDDCGNTFSTSTIGGSAKILGTCSITGTALIATNITPTVAWGTSGAAGNGVSGILVNASDSRRIQFTITAAGAPTANPTVAIVFPTPFLVVPAAMQCKQVGGTGAVGAISGENGATITGVTLTWTGTPVAASTYIISCMVP